MKINELILQGAKILGITPETLTSDTRKDDITIVRHAIANIAYDNGYKYSEIAVALKRKNIGTISNSRKRAAEMLKNNRDFRATYSLIQACANG